MKLEDSLLTTGKTYYVEPIGNGHPADWGKCDYGDNMGVLGLVTIFPNQLSMVIGVVLLGLLLVKM